MDDLHWSRVRMVVEGLEGLIDPDLGVYVCTMMVLESFGNGTPMAYRNYILGSWMRLEAVSGLGSRIDLPRRPN